MSPGAMWAEKTTKSIPQPERGQRAINQICMTRTQIETDQLDHGTVSPFQGNEHQNNHRDLATNTDQPTSRRPGAAVHKMGRRKTFPNTRNNQPGPENIATYWEPFTGGGAVFFALQGHLEDARLSDINPELVTTYQAVKHFPHELIELLQIHAEAHPRDDDYYYRVRRMAHLQSPIEVAARFIYLNKTCYNGLYRVNRKGYFNVAKGRYNNPLICNADGILQASEALQKADIKHGDFGNVQPNDSDFIYCDPPHDGTFAGYTTRGFREHDQQRLHDACMKWRSLGATVMISNADTPLIRELYGSETFTIHQVSASRTINQKASARGRTTELLITTF